ncbi:hypothetical protein CAEBREN_00215 [Caenorhabditis brenneri]|uniref:JmjC domain-containing protein n=1 Tax=Caenorhabditis brenneri TaxID=135651 RepID=G0NJV9_CAEBE|nr:hypothetical protein CAEBREN_00215 [Caenorhabditis brenneri]
MGLETAQVSMTPSSIAHRLRRRVTANPEEIAAELPPKTRAEFQERLKTLEQNTKGFMRECERGENLLDNENQQGADGHQQQHTTTRVHDDEQVVGGVRKSSTDHHLQLAIVAVRSDRGSGRKIFYVAPPTPENLELNKKIEQHEFEDEWIGDMLFDQWVRIEIREWQTAMIPSGYLHFVYTPEDSIVIGGNFLMEKYVERQFEMSKLEDYCAANKFCGFDNLFRGFWSAMWSYAEPCLILELTDSQPPNLVDMAKIFLEELALKLEEDLKKEEEEKKKKEKEWFSCAKKKMILEKLERLCQ